MEREHILDKENRILASGTLTFVVNIKPCAGYYCQTKQQPILGRSDITK
jgi:hypothetical protein